MKKISYLIPCLALGLTLGACKKPVEQAIPAPAPIATPQPSNEVLAFTRAGAIWLSDHNGAQARLLAAPAKGQSFWFPTPSVDGSHWLAWLAREDGTQEIVKVDLAGKTTVLTDIGSKAVSTMKNMRLGNAPSYSPDGKRIIYSFNGLIWTMDANGYNVETIIDDAFSWAPSFSPDGKRIAYVNGQNGHFDLWVSSSDGHDPYQVSDFNNFSAGHPRWSQDGKRIYLTRSQGDESDIVAILAETEKPLADADVLTKDHLSAGAFLNPGGNRLVFSSARADGVHWDLYSADLTGQNAQALTKDGGSAPAWMRVATPVAASAATVQPAIASTAVPTMVVTAPPAPQPTLVPATQVTLQATVQPTAKTTSAPTVEAGVVIPVPENEPKVKAAPTPLSKAADTAQAINATPKITAATTTIASPLTPAITATTAVASAASLTNASQGPAPKAAIRLRYKAIFTAENTLTAEALEALVATADEVKKNKNSPLVVFGPQDPSPVPSSYPSAEARSQSRAQVIADELAKMAGLKKDQIKVQPYSPPSLNGGEGTVILYINL